MRVKTMKKLKMLILVAILSVISSVSVSASSLMDVIDGIETTGYFSEDTSYSLLRGNNLNLGTTKITKLSSNEINVYGLTQCHRVCDTVYLELYLERKVGGSYSTYKMWDFTNSNASQSKVSMNVVVPSGYYYRIRGYHAAEEGGTIESTTSLTQGVLVN